ncbi:MAG TPA: hypothetical protein VER11_34445 [Polyangiaceae bacterium]|nr:hypothetical protein [Polyangiaceae bacterium]
MSGVPVFPQVLQSQRAAGTLFNTYTTAKSVINATELQTLPANYLTVGSKIRTRVWGGLSNIVTTPGTVTFQLMMGSIVAWTSGAIQMSTTAHTLIPFTLDITNRVDSIGAGTAAKLIGGGTLNGIMFTVGAGADSTTVVGSFPVPATAPAVGTGFDSTIANILDFWVGFSISNAGNGVQIYDIDHEQKMF